MVTFEHDRNKLEMMCHRFDIDSTKKRVTKKKERKPLIQSYQALKNEVDKLLELSFICESFKQLKNDEHPWISRI